MRSYLKGLAWVAGVIAVLMLLARIFLVKTWRVPTDDTLAASIAPTLQAGDLVLVLHWGKREAGDLVRCPHPEEGGRWVVGRIIGSGGDRVKVDGSFVEVNGRKYRTTEVCLEDVVEVTAPGGVKKQLRCNRVDFGGGWHFIAYEPGVETTSNEVVVGQDRVFLVSDNRRDFWDSRDYGTAIADSCSERIVFRLWGKNGFSESERRFDAIR